MKFAIWHWFFPSDLFSLDCESHCKASKGKMKITMKKYCKKDYGEWVQYAGMCAARRQPAVKRSDVSINQIPSKANPHPVSVMTYSHSLRRCPLIQINLKTYLFSLLWASTHTKLTIPTSGNWGFSRVDTFEVWTGKDMCLPANFHL